MKISLDKIKDPLFPIRTYMIKEALEGLAKSMESRGLKYPIIVRKVNDEYEIIDGHRRFTCATMLGWNEIEAIIVEAEDKDCLIDRILCNIQHEDTDPIGEAQGFALAREQFGFKPEEIASSLGVSRSYVVNRIRLLALPETTRKAIMNRELEPSKALELLALLRDDYIEAISKIRGIPKEQAITLAEDRIVRMTKDIVRFGWTVDAIRTLIKSHFLEVRRALAVVGVPTEEKERVEEIVKKRCEFCGKVFPEEYIKIYDVCHHCFAVVIKTVRHRTHE